MRNFDLIIGGNTVRKSPRTSIKSPYDGAIAGKVVYCDKDDFDRALQSAHESFKIASTMPAHDRARMLRRISAIMAERRQELAEIIRDEAGKPITLALREVERAVSTFALAAGEALRIDGSCLPLDSTAVGAGRTGLYRRFPLGPILGITPFNFPLNLVCHKVAPAIAAGNSIVIKPSSQTPMSSLVLQQIAADAGLPAGVLNVVPCPSSVAGKFVGDPRIKMVTFTGSAEVGWGIKQRAGKARVTLELGGNAATIVEPDCDIEGAARRLAAGAFSYAGQTCISVQRIYVHESLFDYFMELFLHIAGHDIRCGDPSDPDVICGPMIDNSNADRIEEWIKEARDAGAKVHRFGRRKGNIVPPTVLASVDPKLRICDCEAFAPVAIVDSYKSFDEAIAKVNDTRYGLQAGIFTNDIGKVLKAYRELDVGGIIHNDTSMYRTDGMPYGGTKDSGLGREGLRYAIEEMTEPRLLVIRES
ncbi:MAG: aldehyde dehydrogenase family protein [Dehalococcoidia bacterium]